MASDGHTYRLLPYKYAAQLSVSITEVFVRKRTYFHTPALDAVLAALTGEQNRIYWQQTLKGTLLLQRTRQIPVRIKVFFFGLDRMLLLVS